MGVDCFNKPEKITKKRKGGEMWDSWDFTAQPRKRRLAAGQA